MSDGERFAALTEFAAVAQKLSFVAAARELEMDPSVLSRRIARLESRLGVRLLQRTTRRVSLTEAGARFLERCRDVLDRLDDAEAEISQYAAEPAGVLRVAVPNVYGQRVIAPLVPAFLKTYPALQLEMTFSDRFVDLVEDRLDAAVRIGAHQAGGDVIARRLTTNPRCLYASPAYLSERGAPTRPEELIGHSVLHFSRLLGGNSWRLSGKLGSVEVTLKPLLRADNIVALHQAALAGCGIALLADFVADEDLAAGRLVKVLPDWAPPRSQVSVIYPNAPYTPPKVRAWLDFLIARLVEESD